MTAVTSRWLRTEVFVQGPQREKLVRHLLLCALHPASRRAALSDVLKILPGLFWQSWSHLARLCGCLLLGKELAAVAGSIGATSDGIPSAPLLHVQRHQQCSVKL